MKQYSTKLTFCFFIACILGFFVACTDIERLRISVNIKDKDWVVLGVESQQKFTKAVEGATLSFDIEQKRLFGNTGCNNYAANFEIRQHIIAINNHSTIRKICESQKAMIFEFEFLRTIEGKFELISLNKYKQHTLDYKAPEVNYESLPKNTMVLMGKKAAYFLHGE